VRTRNNVRITITKSWNYKSLDYCGKDDGMVSWYATVGTGCTPLLQCIGQLSLPSSKSWLYNDHLFWAE